MSHLKTNNSISVRKDFPFQSSTTHRSPGFENGDELNFGYEARSIKRKFRNEVFNFFVESFYLKEKVHIKEFLEDLERNIIVKTLTKFNGNQKHTAKYLGLKYTTLNKKVKKHNIHFCKHPIEELF